MDTVKYLNEDIITNYLFDQTVTCLEGFYSEKRPIGAPAWDYSDYGKYIRLLKVPIRDNVSELYMQVRPWRTCKEDTSRPIGYATLAYKFERVAVIINSSQIWLCACSDSVSGYLYAMCPKLKPMFLRNDFLYNFWKDFPNKILEEYEVPAVAETNESVKSLAMQYVILDALTNPKAPVSFDCVKNALKTVFDYENINHYGCAIDYGCDPEGCISSMVRQINRKHYNIVNRETEKGPYLPKKVAAARIAKEISSSFIRTDNESQKIAGDMLAYCKYKIAERNIVDVAIGDGVSDAVRVKIPLYSFFHYEPETKELYINVSKVPETKREAINLLVKNNNNSFVDENLVPMNFLQEVFFDKKSEWNREGYLRRSSLHLSAAAEKILKSYQNK